MQVDFEMMFQIPARSQSGDSSAEPEQFPLINPDYFFKKNEIVPNQALPSCLVRLCKEFVLSQFFILYTLSSLLFT